MYLEPCEEYGYGYLKAVKAAVESMTKDGREVGREKSTDSGRENKTRGFGNEGGVVYPEPLCRFLFSTGGYLPA